MSPEEKDQQKEAQKKQEEAAKESEPQDIGNQIDTSNILEVEEMPESSELQRRRQQTKAQLQDLANVDDEEGSAAFGEEEEGGLMALLKESNLSTKHLKFCCGAVVIVGIIVAAVYGIANGGISKIASLFEGDEKPAEEEVVDEDEDGDEEPVEEDEEVQDVDTPLGLGITIGTSETVDDETSETGEEIGEVAANSEFAQMLEDFQKVYSGASQDVWELLDQSDDRSKALEEFIDKLHYLEYLGRTNVEKLQQQNEQISNEFTAAEEQRDEAEAEFFAAMENMDGNKSTAALDQYILHAERVVDLRAKFRARARLIDFYESVMEDLALRITDIELNKEALVKGVKVVDIRGSDIDLIIDESEF